MEWESVSEVSSIHVTVRPGDGGTRVRISSKQGWVALLTYLLSGDGWFILMGIAGSILQPGTAAGNLALVSGAAGCAYLRARTVWSARARSLRKRLNRLLGALSGTLSGRGRRLSEESAADDPEALPGA